MRTLSSAQPVVGAAVLTREHATNDQPQALPRLRGPNGSRSLVSFCRRFVAVDVLITGNARGTLRRTHRLDAIRRTVSAADEWLVAAVGGLSPQSMSATPRARSSSPKATGGTRRLTGTMRG